MIYGVTFAVCGTLGDVYDVTKEFEAKGEKFNFEEVVKQIQERDQTEFTRKESPLIQCEDAIVLDTSELDFEQSCQALIDLIKTKLKI